MGKIPFPDVLRIEPASACNLNCIHCPNSGGGVMTEKTFSLVMEEMKRVIPRVVVMYHGGEPLLCRSLWKWVKRIKQLGVYSVKVTTNGTLIDNIRDIVNSKVDLMEVSIDGISPEENDFIRRGSDCQAVIGNVLRLLDNKITVTIANTQFSAQPVIPSFLVDVFGDRVKYRTTPVISWDSPRSIKNGSCSLLDETMTIRWNGDVVPCCYDITSKYVMGNIHEASLKEIRGKSYGRIAQGIRENNPVNLCKGCLQK